MKPFWTNLKHDDISPGWWHIVRLKYNLETNLRHRFGGLKPSRITWKHIRVVDRGNSLPSRPSRVCMTHVTCHTSSWRPTRLAITSTYHPDVFSNNFGRFKASKSMSQMCLKMFPPPKCYYQNVSILLKKPDCGPWVQSTAPKLYWGTSMITTDTFQQFPAGFGQIWKIMTFSHNWAWHVWHMSYILVTAYQASYYLYLPPWCVFN